MDVSRTDSSPTPFAAGRWSALLRRVVLPAVILAWACALRVVFFSGFVLCDDREEFWIAVHASAYGPVLSDQFQLRFGIWLFNAAAFKLFGVSEFAFFAPTVLMSASLGVAGYAILVRWGYALLPAFAAALMIAAAPFEVLLGTLRANDVILAWLVGLALAALIVLDSRPVWQGLAVTLFGWLAFYVKLWVVYFLPVLGLHYLLETWRRGRWRGGVVFALASLVLHGATCAFWKRRTGTWLPFLWHHAATYPVRPEDLSRVFRIYPDLLLHGSELGTTLFGSVPYLVVLGLALKLAGTGARRLGVPYRMDARDWALFGCYASFLLLLNFFPNSFTFDRYYSVPRIFRYLAPLSFPMTLHLAKMVLDLVPARAGWLSLAALLALTGSNLRQSAQATAPGRAYRARLMAIVRDVRERRPPMLVTEGWVSYFLSNVYLRDLARKIEVVPVIDIYDARDYEAWLWRRQSGLVPGTLLLTGFGSCVHYSAIRDGFRLALFQRLPSGPRAGAPLEAHGAAPGDAAEARRPGRGQPGPRGALQGRHGTVRRGETRGGRALLPHRGHRLPGLALRRGRGVLLRHLPLPRGQVAGDDHGLRGARGATDGRPVGPGGLLSHRPLVRGAWRPRPGAGSLRDRAPEVPARGDARPERRGPARPA